MGSPDEAYNNPVESMNFIRATLEADGDGYALRIATPDEADLLLPWPAARHTAGLVEQLDKPVILGLRPEHFSEEDVRLSGINRGDARRGRALCRAA